MKQQQLPQILLPNAGLTMRYSPALANEIGPLESILLLQVEWWLNHDMETFWEDGQKWLKKGKRGIATALGMKPSTVHDLLASLEKRALIRAKVMPKGARIPITLDWEGVRNLNSLEVKVSESRIEVSETRTHKDKDSLESKDSSSLLIELAALKAEIARLQTELANKSKGRSKRAKSDVPKPDNWGEVMQKVGALFPGKTHQSAGPLAKAWENYPAQWVKVWAALDVAYRKHADNPGAFALGYLRNEHESAEAAQMVPEGGESSEPVLSSWRCDPNFDWRAGQ